MNAVTPLAPDKGARPPAQAGTIAVRRVKKDDMRRSARGEHVPRAHLVLTRCLRVYDDLAHEGSACVQPALVVIPLFVTCEPHVVDPPQISTTDRLFRRFRERPTWLHLAACRIAKVTGGQILLSLAGMDGEELFDPALLGTAEKVRTRPTAARTPSRRARKSCLPL